LNLLLAKEIQQPVYGNFIKQTIITEKEVYRINMIVIDRLTDLEDSLRKYISKVKE